jgi:hypothetical protein
LPRAIVKTLSKQAVCRVLFSAKLIFFFVFLLSLLRLIHISPYIKCHISKTHISHNITHMSHIFSTSTPQVHKYDHKYHQSAETSPQVHKTSPKCHQSATKSTSPQNKSTDPTTYCCRSRSLQRSHANEGVPS